MLDTAFPFEHGPAGVIILCQFAKNGFKVDLPIAERSESACPVNPWLITTVYSLLARRIKFCILYVECAYTFMIVIYISQIIELLQHKVRRIIKQTCARM